MENDVPGIFMIHYFRNSSYKATSYREPGEIPGERISANYQWWLNPRAFMIAKTLKRNPEKNSRIGRFTLSKDCSLPGCTTMSFL
jgi:hypothetical protein